MLRMRLERSTEFQYKHFVPYFRIHYGVFTTGHRVRANAIVTKDKRLHARGGATPRARGELGGKQLYFLGDLESRALI